MLRARSHSRTCRGLTVPLASDPNAATVRALCGDPTVRLNGRRLSRGHVAVPIAAAHLTLDEPAATEQVRGIADGIALRLRHSDYELHRQLMPTGSSARWVFEMLEQFRVESLADARQPGVRDNLRNLHERWSLAYDAAGLTSSHAGIVLYAVTQICRSHVTRDRVLEATADLLEEARAEFAPYIGHALAGLRATRTDQAAYAVHARLIAEHVEGLVGDDVHDDVTEDLDGSVLTQYVDPGDESIDGGWTTARGRARTSAARTEYVAYTTAYDQVRDVRTLVRPAQLERFRRELDEQVAATAPNVRRVARDLHRLLREPITHGWSSGHDEGVVDGRRLSRLVTSPAQRDIFRLPGTAWEPDCHVAVLVDCSGSMKASAVPVAVFVDVLARALDLAGITSEVLGFTTGTWNGGRALRDWERSGRPPRPGRLNELSHLILRDPELPWRKARSGIAALFRPDLFREGIDGEAVQWASRRVTTRDTRRRVLIVVSDGSPMDAATARANGPTYLDDHLRRAVRESVRTGIEVIGVGVGAADLSVHFDRWMRFDPEQGANLDTYRTLLTLIGSMRR